jgi:hypothetical protein
MSNLRALMAPDQSTTYEFKATVSCDKLAANKNVLAAWLKRASLPAKTAEQSKWPISDAMVIAFWIGFFERQ